jgi:hypothetical protein
MSRKLAYASFLAVLTVAGCNSPRAKSGEHEHNGKGESAKAKEEDEDEEEEEEENEEYEQTEHAGAEKETAIAVAALPSAVREAAMRLMPHATISEAAELGDSAYELELTEGSQKSSLTLTADGASIEIEQHVDTAKLPPAVLASIKAHHPQATIKGAESVQTFVYEVVVVENGKPHELTIAPNGQIDED